MVVNGCKNTWNGNKELGVQGRRTVNPHSQGSKQELLRSSGAIHPHPTLQPFHHNLPGVKSAEEDENQEGHGSGWNQLQTFEGLCIGDYVTAVKQTQAQTEKAQFKQFFINHTEHQHELSCSSLLSSMLHWQASGHSFKDEDVHILDREECWFERGVKEAIYVKRERPSLNRGGGLREYCNSLGGNLASATNPKEYSFLQQKTQTAGQSAAWLGGIRLQDQWLWIDSEGFYYTNWYTQSSSSSCPCLYLRDNYGWGNTQCTTSYSFICSKNAFGC
ncbi:hypothetical protein ACER0C_009687 [Sarotherodon galilaeus]